MPKEFNIKARGAVLSKKSNNSQTYIFLGSTSTTIKIHNNFSSMLVSTFDSYILVPILSLIFTKTNPYNRQSPAGQNLHFCL